MSMRKCASFPRIRLVRSVGSFAYSPASTSSEFDNDDISFSSFRGRLLFTACAIEPHDVGESVVVVSFAALDELTVGDRVEVIPVPNVEPIYSLKVRTIKDDEEIFEVAGYRHQILERLQAAKVYVKKGKRRCAVVVRVCVVAT